MSAKVERTRADAAGTRTPYVALLRGINVGGRNLVRMPELVACFSDAGYGDVSTYLQSGNVLFSAAPEPASALESKVEAMLEQRLGIPLLVVIRSRDELAQTIEDAPADHGSPKLRSDVIFLKHPLTTEQAFAELPELRDGVDAVARGPGAIYFSRVAAQATKTRIQKLMAMPIFQQMTMRNWRTCTTLLTKLDEAVAARQRS
ncbi:DUF1697 domain-containing protein [Agromyces subbeticus]|uniref:DUF1697 domain-containing protein n=1 Tax=Agromyces subbeticus TaxID=293890 RepID=UPI0003B56387|nr:DUF1697 domain-containing protein [Agromyces subbeticus]